MCHYKHLTLEEREKLLYFSEKFAKAMAPIRIIITNQYTTTCSVFL